MAARTLRCKIEELADWYPQHLLDPYIVACVAADPVLPLAGGYRGER